MKESVDMRSLKLAPSAYILVFTTRLTGIP